MNTTEEFVLIVLGSGSDLPQVAPAQEVLTQLNIPFETRIASAHRTPDDLRSILSDAEQRGCAVILAAAGLSAHLAGTVAAHSLKPVIGIPIVTGPLQGVDALLSTIQMPKGVPVACTGLGISANSAWMAARILALSNPTVAQKLAQETQKMADKVRQQDADLNP
ncbi:MAG: 5-(carboxyamino)imidazole ribonucleotide mutase [Gammaproteobacteria bacterium]